MSSPHYPKPHLFIDGQWLSKGSGHFSDVRNPATGDVIGHVPHASTDHLSAAVAAAARSFETWRKTTPAARATILRSAAQLLRSRIEEHAPTLTLEQGKPLTEARSELLASAAYLEFGAEEAARASALTLPARPGSRHMIVRKEPIGAVAAFSPWNFPASLAARKVASALGAGCTIVIKPAEETPGAFLGIARALDDAGLPKGVLNVVFGRPPDVSRHLIASPEIRKVAFTGSTRVGKELAALAGAHAKPLVMELGGHAPVVVFEDADPVEAAHLGVASKYRNAGQVCVSPTRFFVHERIYARFVTAFLERVRALRIGSGLDSATTIGPLGNARRIDAVENIISEAVTDGAKCLTGGARITGNGFFFQPTVLERLADSSRIMNEEPFGPVALVNCFSSFDEAMRRANATPYALAAYAFTRSADIAGAAADALDAGMVGINGFTLAFPDTPTGGRRNSGYGSEGGREGFEAYLMTKTVNEQ